MTPSKRLAALLTTAAVGGLGFAVAYTLSRRVRRATAFVQSRLDGILHHEPLMQVELLSWNVLQSSNANGWGAPWPQRQKAFQHLLADHSADVICLQEVLPRDLEFFTSTLSTHDWIGAGRNDGDQDGEHCPIFYRREKLEKVSGGTFWLSPTPDVPGKAWGETVPRICTWAELRDRASGQRFRVYNSHFPLHPRAQPRSAEVIAQRARKDGVPSVVCGDLNCSPRWPAIKILEAVGFRRAESSGAMTFHYGGRGLRCLDHILVDRCWRVTGGDVLDGHLEGVHPSDHFGLLAKLDMIESH